MVSKQGFSHWWNFLMTSLPNDVLVSVFSQLLPVVPRHKLVEFLSHSSAS